MEAAWNPPFRARVAKVHDDCGHIVEMLAAAAWQLQLPQVLQTRSAVGEYTLLRSAALNVAEATRCLSDTIASMGAAELLALRGCGAVPTEPVASVRHLRDRDHRVWLALIRLEGAREHALDALGEVDGCRSRLQAATFMLEHLPGVPAAGLRNSIEDQIRAAALHLRPAVLSTVNMASLANFATEPADRVY